jgi:hypothetical protein
MQSMLWLGEADELRIIGYLHCKHAVDDLRELASARGFRYVAVSKTVPW